MNIFRNRLPHAALAAGAIALAGALSMTGMELAFAASPAAPKASQVVVVSCAGKGQVRPTGYDVGCMANELLTGLHWTSWNSTADGTGTFKVDNCVPSCAAGKYLSYPVKTHLWRAEPWPGHAGRKYFTRLTVTFTGKRPKSTPKAITLTLPAW